MQIKCVYCGSVHETMHEAGNYCPNCGAQLPRQAAPPPAQPYYQQPPAAQVQVQQPQQQPYYQPPAVQAQPQPGYIPPAYNPGQGYNPPYPPAPPAPVQNYNPPAYPVNPANNLPAQNNGLPNNGLPAINIYTNPPRPAVYTPPNPAYNPQNNNQNNNQNYNNQNNNQNNNNQNRAQYQPSGGAYGNYQNARYGAPPAQKKGRSYAAAFFTCFIPLIPIYEFCQKHVGRGILKLILFTAMIVLFVYADTQKLNYNSYYDNNYKTVNTASQVINVKYNDETYSRQIQYSGSFEMADNWFPEYYLTQTDSKSSSAETVSGVAYKDGDYVRIGGYAYRLYVYNTGYRYCYGDWQSKYYDTEPSFNLYFAGEYSGSYVHEYYVEYPYSNLNTPAVMIMMTLAIWQFVDWIVILARLSSGERIE